MALPNIVSPPLAPLGAPSNVKPMGKPLPMGLDWAYSVLAENLPGYEKRVEQEQLTAAIVKSLESGNHLVAEAPTGTGKSFTGPLAYMATYYGTGKTMVIATANNNLLEQYASKDLPFLQRIFPGFRFARAKGKNNYACVDKAEKLFQQTVLFDQGEGMRQLRQWYDGTSTGDREEISFKVSEEDWRKVNADDTCTGKKCPFYKDCHYYKAKDDLADAHVIVTNFDLMLLELLNPEIQIFPKYDAIIFDEAHQLEDKAISKLETSLTEKQVLSYLKKAEALYNLEDKGTSQGIHLSTVRLFNAYRSLLAQGEEKKSIIANQELIDLTSDFANAMRLLRGEVSRFKTPESSRERRAQDNLMDSISGAAAAAQSAVTNNKRFVSWVEQTKNDFRIVTCPFRVQKQLYDAVFSDPDKVIICLSATLCAGGNKPQFTATALGLKPAIQFEQFRKRVGLLTCSEFICPSPFDYRKNCVLYLPKPPEAAQDANSEAWREWMKGQTLDLIKLSQGRAFVLTTSSKATKEMGEYLAKHLSYPVKAQTPELPNSKLIEWFKETPNAVIVGTSSFWQGVSVEGDDLKLVVIDKIPFTPHKEPLNQAREAWYKADPERSRKSFMDLQLFPAIIQLKQGFGRLHRTKTDTGVVALLDPRLTSKNYRHVILNSLPVCTRADSLTDRRLIELLQ